MKKKLIVIDPGHGGKDSGAVGTWSQEKDIVLEVCFLVRRALGSAVDVMLTRSDDRFLTLQERPGISNKLAADAFVSVHCNSADNKAAKGWEIFTTPGQNNSDKLADAIGKQYGDEFPAFKSRCDLSDGDLDKEANFSVIRGTNCPSTLLELGFISNVEEEEILNNPEYQLAAAEAIASGILDFLNIKEEPADNELTTSERLDEVERRLDAANL